MVSKPKEVSGRTYLYRLFDRQGALLYVGITGDLGQRWKKHMREKHWWGQVISAWEQIDPHEQERPRRRYYQLTPESEQCAREKLTALADALRPPELPV